MLDDLIAWRGTIQYVLIFATTAFAFWRGAAPERWAGGITSTMVLVFLAYRYLGRPDLEYGSIIPGYFAIDLLGFLALVPLAMRANRIYPLWLLAAQLIMLGMHFQRFLPAIDPLGYFVLVHGPSWIQAIALLVGIVLHRRRVKRFGPYRSWRTPSPR